MNSFKEKEKKYKYKFFKAVLDKDHNNIHTYVQKYSEYCTDSDIKNIFNKKNNLYGGSFNDDEKKYKYKFFKAVSDKKYKKLDAYVLKYADHTKDRDVKNMFGGLIDDDKLKYDDILNAFGAKVDAWNRIVDTYNNIENDINKCLYFQNSGYKQNRFLNLKVNEFNIKRTLFRVKVETLNNIYYYINNKLPDYQEKMLIDEFNALKHELDTSSSHIDKEFDVMSKLFTNVNLVIHATNDVTNAQNDIDTDIVSDADILAALKTTFDTATTALNNATTALDISFNDVGFSLAPAPPPPPATSTTTPSAVSSVLLDSKIYNNPAFFYNKFDGPEKK